MYAIPFFSLWNLQNTETLILDLDLLCPWKYEKTPQNYEVLATLPKSKINFLKYGLDQLYIKLGVTPAQADRCSIISLQTIYVKNE